MKAKLTEQHAKVKWAHRPHFLYTRERPWEKKVTMSPLLLSQEKNLNPHPFPPTTTIHFFIFIIQALQFSSALSLIKRSISAAIGPKGPSFQ